jgi:hypothetical protein
MTIETQAAFLALENTDSSSGFSVGLTALLH